MNLLSDPDHWFHSLDYLSISYYCPARAKTDIGMELSVAEMEQRLQDAHAKMSAIAKAFGKPLVTNKSSSKRFFEKTRQLLADCKEVMIFVDRHTGVQYLTTTAPNSDVIMLKDADGNPLFED